MYFMTMPLTLESLILPNLPYTAQNHCKDPLGKLAIILSVAMRALVADLT